MENESTHLDESRGTILVVDDEAASRAWSRRLLQKAGYQVREAPNAHEALKAVTIQPPDLVLLDVLLPDMDGFEVTRTIRQHPAGAALPIILVTNLGDSASRIAGLEAGANDFLTKPPEEAELLARVQTLLRGKQQQDELLAEKEKTAIFYRIARAVSAELDLETLLARILELTTASLGAAAGTIIMLDEWGSPSRTIFFRRGQPPTVTGVVWGQVVRQGLAGWVIQHRAGAIIADAPQDPRWIAQGDEARMTRAALCVPLTHEGYIAGVLTLTHEQPGYFTPEHLDLLGLIAIQATIALVNAQLFTAVARERGRLAAILASTADAILTTDAQGRITLVNPAAERTFAIRFADLAGRLLEQVPALEDLAKAWRQAAESPETVHCAELALADGRTLFFNISPMAGPRGEGGWVVVMQDITHLKKLERMKNDFVSTVSHDLRSPLTSIRGFAEVLLQTAQGEDRAALEHIKASADRVVRLVNDLLDLGMIEAGVEVRRVSCRLYPLVQAAVAEARLPAQQSKIALGVAVPEEIDPVQGDPRRLRQVLDNLLDNALKYTPAGGSVTVRARKQDGQAIVEVRDTGIGIPREALPRLFEKFYRVPCAATRDTPGTGLGLAIVRAIVEQHGGQVWGQSEPGGGSTFGFSLPFMDEIAVRPAEPGVLEASRV